MADGIGHFAMETDAAVVPFVLLPGERMIRDALEQWESWFGIWHFWDEAAGLSESHQ